jgi:prophage regulatory protein
MQISTHTDEFCGDKWHATTLPAPSANPIPSQSTQDRRLSVVPIAGTPPIRRAVRRAELRQIVPLADTTIYEMERRGEFPRRFNLTPRCVVWDLGEVEAWMEARRYAAEQPPVKRATAPDVRLRRQRPVKAERR